jgi:lipid-A-disaccharide synthase
MDEEVVTELIQDFNTKKIKIELQRILEPNHRTQLLQKYEKKNWVVLEPVNKQLN